MDPYHDNAGKFTSKGGGGAVAGAAKVLAGKTGGGEGEAKRAFAQMQSSKGIPKVTAAHREATIDHFGTTQIRATKVHSPHMIDGVQGGLTKSPVTGENIKVVRVSDTNAYVVHPSEGQHGDSMSGVTKMTPAAAAAKVLGGKDHVAAHNDAVDVRNAQNVQKNAKSSRAIVNAELTKHNTDRGYTRSLLRRARDARDLKAAGVVNNSLAAHKKVNALLAFRRRQASSSVK